MLALELVSHTAQGVSPRQNGTDGSSRQRPSQGFRGGHHFTHGPRVEKKPFVKQRVPNPDEFPVLMGAASPPSRSPGGNGINGHLGPTAAQILQAPAPMRRDSVKESSTKESSTRVGTPDSAKVSSDALNAT
jgi:hypothetical protein